MVQQPWQQGGKVIEKIYSFLISTIFVALSFGSGIQTVYYRQYYYL
jgi:hypothetical protein